MKHFLTILILLTSVWGVFAQAKDDLYYAPTKKTSDYKSEKTPQDYAPVSEYEEPPFYNEHPDRQGNSYNEYGYGNGSQQRTGINTDNYQDDYGNTYVTNNYYGDYNEGPSYTTRMRRFHGGNAGFGYYSNFYDPYWNDPFWYDPYWNNMAIIYRPMFRPYWSYGWGFGWNSWGGWGVGIGWGNPWMGGWGNPWMGGWGNPWMGGWGGGWGNPYWNGYHHGYWNGFHDGFYSNPYHWNNATAGGGGIGGGRNTFYGPRGGATTTTGRGDTGVRGGGDTGTGTTGPRVIRSETPATGTSPRQAGTRETPANPEVRPDTRTPDRYTPRQGTTAPNPRSNEGREVSTPGRTAPAPQQGGNQGTIRNQPQTAPSPQRNQGIEAAPNNRGGGGINVNPQQRPTRGRVQPGTEMSAPAPGTQPQMQNQNVRPERNTSPNRRQSPQQMSPAPRQHSPAPSMSPGGGRSISPAGGSRGGGSMSAPRSAPAPARPR